MMVTSCSTAVASFQFSFIYTVSVTVNIVSPGASEKPRAEAEFTTPRPHPGAGLEQVWRGGGPPHQNAHPLNKPAFSSSCFLGFAPPAHLPVSSSAPISVARVPLHLCAKCFQKHIFKPTWSVDVTEKLSGREKS